MGIVQLPDALQQVIDQQVAAGAAPTAAAFLETAVTRLLADTIAEENEIGRIAEAGGADIAAGRSVTVDTADAARRLRARLAEKLRSRPGAPL